MSETVHCLRSAGNPVDVGITTICGMPITEPPFPLYARSTMDPERVTCPVCASGIGNPSQIATLELGAMPAEELKPFVPGQSGYLVPPASVVSDNGDQHYPTYRQKLTLDLWQNRHGTWYRQTHPSRVYVEQPPATRTSDEFTFVGHYTEAEAHDGPPAQNAYIVERHVEGAPTPGDPLTLYYPPVTVGEEVTVTRVTLGSPIPVSEQTEPDVYEQGQSYYADVERELGSPLTDVGRRIVGITVGLVSEDLA